MEQPSPVDRQGWTELHVGDVSNGLEPTPIRASGDGIEKLRSLRYVTDSVLPDGTSISLVPPPSSDPVKTEAEVDEDDVIGTGCQCRPQSDGEWSCTRSDGGYCECVGEYGNFYTIGDTANGGEQTLNLDALPERWPLVECSSACSCDLTCANRLTQRGVRASLIVRPVPLAGFGLFYSPSYPTTLPRGTFISLYAGEYLTTLEARVRWASLSNPIQPGEGNYILTLRLPDQILHIDPRRIGNVGRYLNHSCDPNCIIQVVRWGTGSWPRAAIFTKREIRPNEELTFDYGNASGSAPSTGVDGEQGDPRGSELHGGGHITYRYALRHSGQNLGSFHPQAGSDSGLAQQAEAVSSTSQAFRSTTVIIDISTGAAIRDNIILITRRRNTKTSRSPFTPRPALVTETTSYFLGGFWNEITAGAVGRDDRVTKPRQDEPTLRLLQAYCVSEYDRREAAMAASETDIQLLSATSVTHPNLHPCHPTNLRTMPIRRPPPPHPFSLVKRVGKWVVNLYSRAQCAGKHLEDVALTSNDRAYLDEYILELEAWI